MSKTIHQESIAKAEQKPSFNPKVVVRKKETVTKAMKSSDSSGQSSNSKD